MPKKPNVPKIERRISQIKKDLEYEYDYYRVKELREELDLLQRRMERLKKCNH